MARYKPVVSALTWPGLGRWVNETARKLAVFGECECGRLRGLLSMQGGTESRESIMLLSCDRCRRTKKVIGQPTHHVIDEPELG